MTCTIFYVRKKTLLLLASFMWLVAGFNVLRLGLLAYQSMGKLTAQNLLLTTLVTTMFGLMFYKMTRKHLRRIKAYTSKTLGFWHFFDLKSYLIMAFMMSMGIYLRAYHLVPLNFIAFFYTGIGLALTLAGALFAKYFLTFDDL